LVEDELGGTPAGVEDIQEEGGEGAERLADQG
jgi:hypothetical protein